MQLRIVEHIPVAPFRSSFLISLDSILFLLGTDSLSTPIHELVPVADKHGSRSDIKVASPNSILCRATVVLRARPPIQSGELFRISRPFQAETKFRSSLSSYTAFGRTLYLALQPWRKKGLRCDVWPSISIHKDAALTHSQLHLDQVDDDQPKTVNQGCRLSGCE